MENLISLTWLPSWAVYAILVVVGIIALVAVRKIVKAIVFKVLGCPLTKVCKKVCSYLPGNCSCEGCAGKSCTKWGKCGPCLPVKIILWVVSAVITLTVFGFIASFLGLPGVSAILTSIIGVVWAVIAWFTWFVKSVLLLVPQTFAVYLAGRSIYKGPQAVLEEVKAFFVGNIKGLFNKAVDTVDSASNVVSDKIV